MRIESPSGDVSFEIPSTGNFVYNDEFGYRIWHNEQGVSLRFMVTRNGDPKKLIKQPVPKEVLGSEKFYTVGDFIIRQYVEPDSDSGASYQNLAIASPKGYYTVTALVANDLRNIYPTFLSSIRLNDKPIFKSPANPPEPASTVRINKMKPDASVSEALNKPDAKGLKLEREGKIPTGPGKKVFYSRDLVIVRKPFASFTDEARAIQAQGTVVLRVTFGGDGQIKRIAVRRSLEDSLDRSAFEAAKRIKFIPAELDGKPVDAERSIEYRFAIY